MAGIIYYCISLVVNFYILIAVYYYCIKTYGFRATIITNLSLSSMVLTLIFTGTYSVADLDSDLQFIIDPFLITDPITIFTVFIVVFELARYSLKKTKGTDLSVKDIFIISVVVTLYGILFQLLMDPTAAALGIYYYQNPPPINIFGFPIWFMTSFAIYGLFAFVFLLIERYYFHKKEQV
ncbi:MAG: hypothetical protein JSV62_04920 [Promethearchaeota archaeon]|nr:MAG: hypothetical protein JSV62_04920 [Candidatus Lokiarchaeota archaeon]